MTITFRNRNGDPLVDVDSDTILSEDIKVTFHTCPVCERAPFMGRDGGRWYLIGTAGCPACYGTRPMPDEAELADISAKNS